MNEPFILTLRLLPYNDHYYLLKPRTEPLCPSCERDTMELIDDAIVAPPPFFEEWRCKVCRCRESYAYGAYGETSVAVTRQEWEEHMLHRRQVAYLKRRYPTGVPSNLRNYWVKD